MHAFEIQYMLMDNIVSSQIHRVKNSDDVPIISGLLLHGHFYILHITYCYPNPYALPSGRQ